MFFGDWHRTRPICPHYSSTKLTTSDLSTRGMKKSRNVTPSEAIGVGADKAAATTAPDTIGGPQVSEMND
uniref:Uncharacterized protein n=1 Tax=Heterorhabditis bacteriophora TaxID=37862 RepID=A0A1I7XVA5_HETBA